MPGEYTLPELPFPYDALEPHAYAAFFTDLDGHRLEVFHNTDE
jgi:hypothetical protein